MWIDDSISIADIDWKETIDNNIFEIFRIHFLIRSNEKKNRKKVIHQRSRYRGWFVVYLLDSLIRLLPWQTISCFPRRLGWFRKIFFLLSQKRKHRKYVIFWANFYCSRVNASCGYILLLEFFKIYISFDKIGSRTFLTLSITFSKRLQSK